MSKLAPDDDNVGRRSNRRSSRSSVSEADVKVSRGGPVNAARLDRDVIKEMASQNNTKYLSQIDFCKLSDEDIQYIFVTERTYTRFRDRLIIFPPNHFRRDASNIKMWFNEFGAAARQQAIDDCRNVKISMDHDDTLQWSIEEHAWRKETLPQPQVSAPPPSPEPPRCCQGFMLKDIEAMRLQGDEQEREARRENICLGFKHTIREAYVTRSAVSQPNNDMWQYCPPITGVILHGNDKTKPRWTVEEDQHEIGEDQFEHHKIRAVGCTGLELNDNDVYCPGCTAEKRALLQRFDSNVKLREGEFDPRTRHNVLGRSASLQKQATDYHRRESKNKMKKISRRDKVIAKLEESTGIDVQMNKHTDYLFHPNVEEAGKKFLSEKVGKDSLSEYAFARSMHNHRVAKQSGVHAVRHCPLMIRFAATIRRAMGHKGGLFDLVAKVAGLPTSRTLRKYQVSNSNDPDGMMHKNIARARATYKQKNPNAGRFDYSRHTIMALDSMHTKGRFGVSRNTNELVGVADDAFNNDVILNELTELEKNGDTENEAEMKLPGMAKHFLVFIATTWTPEGKIQFLVARYGLLTITSQTLLREIDAAIVTCALYGFIIDTVSGDGASENRLTWKTLATISAREILGKHWSEEELEGLPLDFKIGFQHPHPMYKDKVTIIIGGEMPHWVKKFRNAFENESRELTFRGKPMNLNQLYEVWKASGDADVVGGASVRLYKFTHDHFKLNAYLKMRVFLAVQIPSQTMITMIKDHCENAENLANIKDYEPMIELFDKIDRLVDIMNGSGYKKGKHRDVQLINHPKHKHISELFDVLRVFEEWKKEAGGFTEKFITKYSYEDLVWMVFGVAAASCLYLKEDGSLTMHQGRSGSDVCEHFFSLIRYINSNPTMQQAREGASAVSGGGGMHGTSFMTENKANAGGAPVATAAELLSPIERVGPAKKKSKIG